MGERGSDLANSPILPAELVDTLARAELDLAFAACLIFAQAFVSGRLATAVAAVARAHQVPLPPMEDVEAFMAIFDAVRHTLVTDGWILDAPTVTS